MPVRGRDNWLTAPLRPGPRQVDIGQTREEPWTVLTDPEGKRVPPRAPKDTLIRQGSALRPELTPVRRSRRFRGDGL
jgi:hypothetical protein